MKTAIVNTASGPVEYCECVDVMLSHGDLVVKFHGEEVSGTDVYASGEWSGVEIRETGIEKRSWWQRQVERFLLSQEGKQ